MGYHLMIETDTKSGKPAREAIIDAAGGRLALLSPAFSFHQTESYLLATVYVERDQLGEATKYGVSSVLEVFKDLGEPLSLRRVAAYTEAEFDRVHVRGKLP